MLADMLAARFIFAVEKTENTITILFRLLWCALLGFQLERYQQQQLQGLAVRSS